MICPYNFVKTKLKLETMEPGQILSVILDAGDPIRNVPMSVSNEGHEVLSPGASPTILSRIHPTQLSHRRSFPRACEHQRDVCVLRKRPSDLKQRCRGSLTQPFIFSRHVDRQCDGSVGKDAPDAVEDMWKSRWMHKHDYGCCFTFECRTQLIQLRTCPG